MKSVAAHLFVILAVIATAIAALVTFRLPLGEAALEWWLARRGLTNVELTIVALDTGRLEITNFRAGSDNAVRVERILVRYTPDNLSAFRARSVTIVAPRLRADISESGIALPGIRLPFDGAAGNGTFALPTDRLTLNDFRLDATTPFGPCMLVASGDINAPVGERIKGWLTATVRGAPGQVDLELLVAGPDLTTFGGMLTITSGAVRMADITVATMQGIGEFSIARGTPTNATVNLRATDMTVSREPGALHGDVTVDATWRPDEAGVTAHFTEAEGGRGLTVDADIVNLAIANGRATGTLSLGARIKNLDVGRFLARDLVLTMPATFTAGPQQIEVALAGPAQLAARQTAVDGVVRSAAPASLAIRPTTEPLVTIERDATGNLASLSHTLSATLAPIGIELPNADSTTRTLNLSEVRLNMTGRANSSDRYTARGTIATSSADLADSAIGLEHIEADFVIRNTDPDGKVRLDIGRLVDTAASPRFHPFGLTVEADIDDGDAVFTARLTDAMRTTRATASGSWPLAGPRDEIFVEVLPIAFKRGGVQPGIFVPGLSAFEVSQGQVSAIARLHRTAGKLYANADISLDALSFDLPGASIVGLTSHIRLDRLVPPQTPADQTLTIERVDMLTPLEDVRIVYGVSANARGRPRFDIASARAGLLGGTVSVDDVALTPGGGTVALPIAVSHLDLPQLFALIGVEGLEGSGQLSGRVPVYLSGQAVEIRAARLAADGAGVIKLESATAAAFLAAQGESVDLAMRALEDFHYSELTVAIDRKSGGDARVELSMLGHNPAVLDGHPFRFNITVNSNIDELLAALLQGYRIATEGLARPVTR